MLFRSVACLPFLVLSNSFMISAMYSIVFIASFLLILFTSSRLAQFAFDKILTLGIQLFFLAAVNGIIQSVINIINPIVFTMYIIPLNLMQYLPFVILQMQTAESDSTRSIIMRGLLVALSGVALGLIREFMTYGNIALGYTRIEKTTTLYFQAGQTPWFVFILMALIITLIKYVGYIRNDKRKVTNGTVN